MDDPRGLPWDQEPRLVLSTTAEGKPLVRWVASYAPEDRKLAEQLTKELELQLKNSKQYCFELWDRSHLLPGEAEEVQLAQHVAEARARGRTQLGGLPFRAQLDAGVLLGGLPLWRGP